MKIIGFFATVLTMLFLSACSTTKEPLTVEPVAESVDCSVCARTIDNKYKIKNKSGLFKEAPIWQPVKVYDDGASVYIKLPAGIKVKPILYILDDAKTPWQLNYQVNKHYYRVDYLFKKALLVLGDEKIEISKT